MNSSGMQDALRDALSVLYQLASGEAPIDWDALKASLREEQQRARADLQRATDRVVVLERVVADVNALAADRLAALDSEHLLGEGLAVRVMSSRGRRRPSLAEGSPAGDSPLPAGGSVHRRRPRPRPPVSGGSTERVLELLRESQRPLSAEQLVEEFRRNGWVDKAWRSPEAAIIQAARRAAGMGLAIQLPDRRFAASARSYARASEIPGVDDAAVRDEREPHQFVDLVDLRDHEPRTIDLRESPR